MNKQKNVKSSCHFEHPLRKHTLFLDKKTLWWTKVDCDHNKCLNQMITEKNCNSNGKMKLSHSLSFHITALCIFQPSFDFFCNCNGIKKQLQTCLNKTSRQWGTRSQWNCNWFKVTLLIFINFHWMQCSNDLSHCTQFLNILVSWCNSNSLSVTVFTVIITCWVTAITLLIFTNGFVLSFARFAEVTGFTLCNAALLICLCCSLFFFTKWHNVWKWSIPSSFHLFHFGVLSSSSSFCTLAFVFITPI